MTYHKLRKEILGIVNSYRFAVINSIANAYGEYKLLNTQVEIQYLKYFHIYLTEFSSIFSENGRTPDKALATLLQRQ